MSVATTRFIASGTYVPFRGVDREVSAVGTFSQDAVATGDASGGTVELLMSMIFIEFGFHPLYVPTRATTLDSLTTPEAVRLRYSGQGNERVEGNVDESVLAVVGVEGVNYATFSGLSIVIEPIGPDGGTVMTAKWSTNEDGDAYHLHVFGLMYDAEAMARGKRRGARVDELLAGIR